MGFRHLLQWETLVDDRPESSFLEQPDGFSQNGQAFRNRLESGCREDDPLAPGSRSQQRLKQDGNRRVDRARVAAGEATVTPFRSMVSIRRRNLRVIAQSEGLQGRRLIADEDVIRMLGAERPYINGPTTIEILQGSGEVIRPDGTLLPTGRALLVPKPRGGYISVFPVE